MFYLLSTSHSFACDLSLDRHRIVSSRAHIDLLSVMYLFVWF